LDRPLIASLLLVVAFASACAAPNYLVDRYHYDARGALAPETQLEVLRGDSGQPVRVVVHKLDFDAAVPVTNQLVRVPPRRVTRLGLLIPGAISMVAGAALMIYGLAGSGPCDHPVEPRCAGQDLPPIIGFGAGAPNLVIGAILLGVGLRTPSAEVR